jgi:hypothetical protein
VPSFSGSSSLLKLLDPEDEGTALLQNIRNFSPVSVMSHRRRLVASVPQMLQ